VNLRQQRGMELAKTRTIRRKGAGVWIVPSQTGKTTYRVYVRGTKYACCSCPDYQAGHGPCKHIFAAFYAGLRGHKNGSITQVGLMKSKRKTYRQTWQAYNGAQVIEKDKFQLLLYDLCSGLPVHPTRPGRQPLPLPDAVFVATFKVYSTMCGRRFISDLKQAHRHGLISRVPHYNTVFNVFANPDLTEILLSLIERTALPLKEVETAFAVDSSGFGTHRYVRWYDHKYDKEIRAHEWVKVHLMCGVKTNIVTAVEIGEPNAADTKMLPPLLATTAKNFKVAEVSGDKAYSSKVNLEAVAAVGGKPFIMFKNNAAGLGGGMWTKTFNYFKLHKAEFKAHYHKRSNIESAFSMIKRKFGNFLRSRTDDAMKNEALCKILCHNIVVLIHEMHELGIDPVFWKNENSKAG
jgi:predicted nucleic acid-binding Zn finger protein